MHKLGLILWGGHFNCMEHFQYFCIKSKLEGDSELVK